LFFSCFANECECVDFVKMFQSPHMHTHVLIRMMLPTSFSHFILIILKGESTLSPPQNCSHMYNIFVIKCFGNVWTSHFEFFCLF
jgi:hypothetical protein